MIDLLKILGLGASDIAWMCGSLWLFVWLIQVKAFWMLPVVVLVAGIALMVASHVALYRWFSR